MDETTFMSDGTVRINSQSVKLGGKSYLLSEVRSVSMRAVQSDQLRDLPYYLVVAGAIMMFAITNLNSLLSGAWDSLVQIVSLVGVLVSLAGLVMLVTNTLVKGECLYVVQIDGEFGSSCPFASDDPRYVRNVVEAIRRAIASEHALADTLSAPLPEPVSR
jgi:hypothetical protein